VYAQAAKGILNGMWKRHVELKKNKAVLKPAEEDHYITDAFEPAVIKTIIDELKTLPDADLHTIAAYIYQRRAFFLRTANKGLKKGKAAIGEGWMKQFTAGIDKGYETQITGTVEGKKIQVKSQTNKDRPSFTPKPEAGDDGKTSPRRPVPTGPASGPTSGPASGSDKGKGGGGGDAGRGTTPDGETTPPPVIDETKLLEIPKISPATLRRFESLFAGAPVEVRYLSNEGEEIDLNEFASSHGLADFFVE
jgi:hypothetical protein